MHVNLARTRRYARLYARTYQDVLTAPLATASQLLTLAASMLATALLIQRGGSKEVEAEVQSWDLAVEAFAYVTLGWATLSLIIAAFRTIKDERAKGVWRGNNFAYHQPQHVLTRQFFANGRTSIETIRFPDAEKGSFVRYSIEFEPPVPGRVSSTLSPFRPVPLQDPNEVIVGGRGGIRLNQRREGFLSVRLKDSTIPVICRVYCHSFSIGTHEYLEADTREA